jgi:hypothetical protein
VTIGTRSSIVIAALLIVATPLAAEADHVSAEWDEGTTEGWLPATGAAVLGVYASGGYSGGYLESSENPYLYGIVGALNFGPEYAGDFDVHGYVRFQVAVKFQIGSFNVVYFHVRYQSGSHNGWYLPLPADTGDSGWQWFDVDFEPTWSDAQAMAAGWMQETNTPSFAVTMSDVYHTGIKGTGTGVLSLGIDAFRLWDETVSAEEKSWSGIKMLYR